MARQSKRDPHKPKRAMTAFMYFSKEMRPRVVEANPDIKFGDIGKQLGQFWKSMTDDEKQRYAQLAAEDKDRYAEQVRNYVPSAAKGGRANKQRADKPKRAMSAYLYFCKEHRESVKAEHPELKMAAIQSKLGQLWTECSEAERVPFQKQAEADRLRYETELNASKSKAGPSQSSASRTW